MTHRCSEDKNGPLRVGKFNIKAYLAISFYEIHSSKQACNVLNKNYRLFEFVQQTFDIANHYSDKNQPVCFVYATRKGTKKAAKHRIE